jgi:SCP-2 sterol transfer family protein
MKGVTMVDPITDFLTRLADHRAGPLLGGGAATIRFDATHAGSVRHWYVRVDGDRVEVTDSGADADCVIGADRTVLEELVTGRRNAMAALLRGLITLSGDPDLLVRLQRLFPGPGGFSRPAAPPPREQPAPGSDAEQNLAAAGGRTP